mmetsp:Transcript_3599/g.7313  ORF Transcript_3599/g.7313 Transcript_3599/m.7313 type:complete len:452 (-) Transcript_3599:22-1377(-)
MNANTKRGSLIVLFITYVSLGLYQNFSNLHGLTKLTTSQESYADAQNLHTASVGKSRPKSESHVSDINPYFDTWKRRFASSTHSDNYSNNSSTGKYLFFKHIRKAGGTTLRSYFKDVLSYHGRTRNENDFARSKTETEERKNDIIYYVEQEFSTMDYECPNIDPRWNNSISVITLRHPIERHLSEFFYSGPGRRFDIRRDQLYVNQTYTKELSEYLEKNVPKWMRSLQGRVKGMHGKFNMYFGRYYVDNFQLRALAGCSSRECLKERNITDEDVLDEIRRRHPSEKSYVTPVPKCTFYFKEKISNTDALQMCALPRETECSECDGPCFYPSVAWGEMTDNDVERATSALEAYDVVLLTETFDEEAQSALLSDVMGVPRDADFALNKKGVKNSVVQKTNNREKTHFYRDMFSKLAPNALMKLEAENEFEIKFFERALEVNKKKTELWKGVKN